MPTLSVAGNTIDVDDALLELDRVEYETDLYAFTVAAWPHIDSAPFAHGGYALQAICAHLEACADGYIPNLLINVPPRFSKPVAANSWVSTHRGLIPLSEVVIGDYVLTHLGRFKRVLAVHQQGILPVNRLTTKRGREIVAAPDHPFLTPYGWQRLSEIGSDDVVGVIPQRISSGEQTISPEEARLLGYLVGDGSCSGTPNVTVADDIEVEDLKYVISAIGLKPTVQTFRMASTGYMLRRVALTALCRHRTKKGYQGPARQFLVKHNLYGKNSYNKHVPDAVMRGSDEIVRNFIGAYWACDGFVSNKGKAKSGTDRDDLYIGCDSVNKAFVLQMQVLLLRLGIDSIVRKKISKIKTKIQGDEYTSYNLGLANQDNCWRFANLIHMHHSKMNKLNEARRRRFDFDRPIVGDVVLSNEPNGHAECICLTVDEDESFVANGFAVHNSTIVGTMFPAWVWAQRERSMLLGPGAQFLCAGYALNLSLQDSVKCRNLITSDWYQRYWGDRFRLVGDQNTKTRFQNDQNGIRNAVSVGGSTTGLGGSYLIGDDLNNAAEANSEAMIEAAINWWNSAWYNRLNNSKPGHGCRIVVAQRLNESDISGHVLESQVGDWTHLVLPMRYEPERSFHTVLVPEWATEDGEAVTWKDPRTKPGELLWPERFDESQVKLLEKTMGPFMSAGQLQQRPEPPGGGVIKRDWWRLWEDSKYPPMDYIIASLDTAYTTKQENDFSALTVWGVFSGSSALSANRYSKRDGKSSDLLDTERLFDESMQVKFNLGPTSGGDRPSVMLMYAWQERLEFPDLVARVIDTCKTMKVDKLLVEAKAAGISLAQELRRTVSFEDYAVQLIDPKNGDKLARLYSVQHIFSEGMVFAPDRAFAEMVISQVGTFPKGKHDDLVDTASQALRHMRDAGLLTRGTEWTAEINESMQHRGKPLQSLYGV